jgi:hypothetical protein
MRQIKACDAEEYMNAISEQLNKGNAIQIQILNQK